MLQPTPRSRPPGPPGIPFSGHSWHFIRDPLRFLTETARKYGDVALIRLGGTDVYFVSEADLVRDVFNTYRTRFEISTLRSRLEVVLGKGLLTSRGELHARQRRLIQPAFRKSMIDSYAGQMAEFAEAQCAPWVPGGEVDVSSEMMLLTMKVAAKSLFNHEVGGRDSDRVARNLALLLEYFSGMMSPFLYMSLKLPLPRTLRFRRALRELDELIYGMIEHRKRHPTGGSDLLTLLMQAQDAESGGTMDDKQLRDELLTLFAAGHETTANVLAWTIFLLSRHPAEQEKLHAEVQSVMAGRTRVTQADVGKFTYARQVITEVLRIYPSVWFVGRNALEDVPLGAYTVPKGANVLLSQWVVHHQERYFPEAERFRPERWTPQFMETLPRGAYFPFSSGERHCVGENFAWLETVLALATLVARWRFDEVPGQGILPKPSVTLRPNKGIRVRAFRRSQGV